MKAKPKKVTEEGPWFSLYPRACNGQEDCLCKDCAWDRALNSVVRNTKNEEKDA